MSRITQLLLAVPLAACAGAPVAQGGADLVILPAPASAWRITVGHWEGQAELTGDSVVAPQPTAEYARNSRAGASAVGSGGRREALRFDWKDLWLSLIHI